MTEVITLMTGRSNVYVIAGAARKDEISELAREIDQMGLEIEREHLIWGHDRRPFSGFRLATEP